MEGGQTAAVGELPESDSSTYCMVNGVDKQSESAPAVDNSKLPSMETMLEAATDLQSDLYDKARPISGRLELSQSPSEIAAPPAGSTPAASSQQQPTGQYIETNSGGYGYSKPVTSLTEGGPSQILVKADTSAKVEALKKWTISAYKCTKQIVSERLGRRTKTVDEDLEKHIEGLRETQRKYANLLKLSKQLTQQFLGIIQTQKSLTESFLDLSMKAPELQDEFNQNGELQKVLVKNGETLLNALGFFTTNLATLCNKTIEDTIQTIRAYELSRVEYDAYRTDMEAYEGSGASARAEDARKDFASQKEKYDKLRSDLQVKLRFLEENKVKVMRKQLLLFHNAIAAYFAGNKKELESTMKEFYIRVQNKGEGASFLEQH